MNKRMVFVSTYSDDYNNIVNLGDTVRFFADNPDNNAWNCTVAITTARGATPAATQALSQYTGLPVRNYTPELGADYDTSSLTANTKYLAVFQFDRGTRKVEYVREFFVLPEGYSE